MITKIETWLRCYLATWATMMRDLALFNELQRLGLKFNAIAVWTRCPDLEAWGD